MCIVDDDDERSDLDETSPSSIKSPDVLDEAPTLLGQARTMVVSLFLPYTVIADIPSPEGIPAAPLERRRSVGAIEFKRQRKASESRALRPECNWWHLESSGLGNIGLQNALKSMQHRMHEPLWIGTLGVSTTAWSPDTLNTAKSKLRDEYNCVPVLLTDDEVEGHYNQFCKQVCI